MIIKTSTSVITFFADCEGSVLRIVGEISSVPSLLHFMTRDVAKVLGSLASDTLHVAWMLL